MQTQLSADAQRIVQRMKELSPHHVLHRLFLVTTKDGLSSATLASMQRNGVPLVPYSKFMPWPADRVQSAFEVLVNAGIIQHDHVLCDGHDAEELCLLNATLAMADTKDGIVCSPDGVTMQWGDQAFTFTPYQTAAIELLYAAYRAGRPDLRGDYILERIGSNGTRLCDVFKRSPAWGTLVKPGERKGTYRIADPPSQ